ncbi:heme-binding protein [Psychromarinibacter halotolerans]|uniref:Heme-binding protein n=1 Tax=Psychromarinibacter halotolerans TaxID=1775175 RepID=A0ABV7GMR9_9RHOB|nr:heme-binding protein [Psychromarinibacter halotolerans]MDF0596651.1 heme-binding protein [Psychromarinibacter halotolerans]
MIEYEVASAGAKREIRPAAPREPALGPLELLPGTWANVRPEHRLINDDGSENLFQGEGTLTAEGASPLDGRGWNIIALPFATPDQQPNYRVLMNQYNEVLQFKKVDENIPNRGITQVSPPQKADQLVAALDYEQMIAQIRAADFPVSGDAGDDLLPIHHEPGFFLRMRDQTIEGTNIARLSTIPHGDSLVALGAFTERLHELTEAPQIPDLSALPEGVGGGLEAFVNGIDLDAPNGPRETYMLPYAHFAQKPFKGVIPFPDGQGFSPINANALLQASVQEFADRITKTTVLQMDTDAFEAGIVNIPFIVRQANAKVMNVTFWIMELDEMDEDGDPKLLLAYSQFIMLDFFGRADGKAGQIRWPHVSINIMEKVAKPPRPEDAGYPAMMTARAQS